MTFQKQLEYIHREFLVEVDYDSGSMKEMKKERIKKTSTIFFAIVTVTALFAVPFIMVSQHVSAAAHHKAHTDSKDKISVHHKVIAVVPEVHGRILNATELKKLVKGPYGESDVIGGMMSGGY